MNRLFILFVLSALLLIGFLACEPKAPEAPENDYVDLGLSVKWATMNIGANSTEGYGDLYYYDEALSEFGDNLPTQAQFEELIDKCEWNWVKQSGVNGYKITGPNGNSIFLPAAGVRLINGEVGLVGTDGSYWSSTPYESGGAIGLCFFNGNYYIAKFTTSGLSVRLVRK